MDPNRNDNYTHVFDDSSVDDDHRAKVNSRGEDGVTTDYHRDDVDDFVGVYIAFDADLEHLEKPDPSYYDCYLEAIMKLGRVLMIWSILMT